MKKILILYDHRSEKCVTGGQFYEEQMYQCMLKEPDIEVERHSINRGRTFITKLLSPILNLKYLSRCRKYDLVIFNSVEGWYFIPLLLILSFFSKTKIAIIHHHFVYMEFSGIKKLFYKSLESSFLRLSNYIITVSPYIQDLCKKKFVRKNVRIWPIPFSDKIIEVAPEIKKEGSLIYIGTIEHRKGLMYLIKSLLVLNKIKVPYHLNIIGSIKDPSYYEKLVSEIKQNNLNVTFHGFVDLETKDKLLRESQIFVFPSILEGYGMVLREVMAYGLPIVCFNNSAMPYLVKNNINGILVENKNSYEMAQAIVSILKNRCLYNYLSKGAYETTRETITPDKYKEILSSELHSII